MCAIGRSLDKMGECEFGRLYTLARVVSKEGFYTGVAKRQRTRFWFKEYLDHRDPDLLGPPLRSDLQSYSALSDYLPTYAYSITRYVTEVGRSGSK